MPVLSIVEPSSDDVIVFLPEGQARLLTNNMCMYVQRSDDPRAEFIAKVVSLAPEIFALPNRVSPMSNQTIRGRRVLIRLTEAHDFIPGETVRVRTGSARGVPFTKWISTRARAVVEKLKNLRGQKT